ncbi:type II restriction endonuclease subunit R [Campylobacter jejuni]|nr:type II restriction endonuclease subunit R [Campylobacter jejuni]
MDKLDTNTLVIRNTDTSKRPENTPDEYEYAKMVEQLARDLGRITQDSLRKNFFVDMERMGLIDRFKEAGSFKRVCITETGKEFLDIFTSSDIFKKNRFWTLCMNKLHKGFENKLFNLMLLIEENTQKDVTLSYDEYAFFATDETKTNNEIADIIIAFKNLSKLQREQITNTLKKYANPQKNLFFSGADKNKKDKRDYHNWINEAQQMFPLLKETILFGIGDIRENELNLKYKGGILKSAKTRRKRSIHEKKKYFEQHNLSKIPGYELHHIVPLLMAKNDTEFDTLDCWQNMILINAYTHSIISTNGSKHIKLDFINDSDDIELKDVSIPPDIIKCTYGKCVKYNITKKDIMQKTNDDILNSI